MLIEIEDELFYKLVDLMKNRNVAIHEQLKQIKPITNLHQENTLQEARAIKTQRVKQTIKDTIKSLYSRDMKPTKYKIHKETNIAYTTLNKYYDDILQESQGGL